MAGASIAQAYQRSARLKASKITRKPEQVELRPDVLKAREDFPAFCTLMGKPPAKHMKTWHRAFLTGDSNDQLLDIAGPNTAILAPRGPLDPELKVATPTGWRRLADLEIGDPVFADDGTPTTVESVVDYTETPCYRVRFSDGLSVVCDESHRFDVKPAPLTCYHLWQTVTLQQIRHYGRVPHPWLDGDGRPRYQVPISGMVRYPRRSLPLDPYLLGALIGGKALASDRLRLVAGDPVVLDQLRLGMPEGATLRPIRARVGGFEVSDPGLVWRILEPFGLGPDVNQAHIPALYLTASAGQRLALLQGLMDLGGTLSNNGGSGGGLTFACRSRALADDMASLVRSLGGLAIERKSEVSRSGRLRFRIALRLPAELAPFCSSSKLRRYKPCAPHLLRRLITSVEPVEPRAVRCISIAHASERFIAEDYLSIKNSAKSTSLCLLLAWLIGRHAAAGKLLRILYVSYNVEVARGKSAAIKNLICTPEYREVFPMVHLSKTRSSDELWCLDWEEAGIDVRGEDAFTLACAGLKGSITSKRSSLVVVDDAIKSAQAIANPDVRREMEGNWESVIVPTMFQGGRAIALGTRFHFDDLFATIFTEKRGWDVLVQQALSYDEDGRARSYWPKMWSAKYLLSRQAANRISFSYQYQNQPIRNTELGISPELFIKGDIPDTFDTIGIGIDLSAGLAERNDWTVFTLAGRDGDKCYVIDYRRLRSMGNLEKIEALCELLLEWNLLRCNDEGQYFPTASQVMVWPEVVAYQKSFEGDLKRMLHLEWGLHNLVVSPIKGFRGDKLARLRGMMGLLEGRKVIFNKYRDFGAMIDEIVNFGHAPHDDMADSLNLVVQGLMRRGRIDIEW